MSYIYYFNPDGTLGTMPAVHNADGSLRPAGSYSTYSPYSTPNTGHNSAKKTTNNANSTPKKVKKTIVAKKKISISSTEHVDYLLNSWAKCQMTISAKSLRKARARLSSNIIKEYFEHKLSDFIKQDLLKLNENCTSSTNTVKSGFEDIVSIKQVDEIITKLSKNAYIPVSSVLDNIKTRIISFSLRDYFDRKIHEMKNNGNKNRTSYKSSTPTIKSPCKKTVSKIESKNKGDISSRSEIDRLINAWIKCNGTISDKAVKKTRSRINSPELLHYFESEIQKFKSCKKITGISNDSVIPTATSKAPKNKIKTTVIKNSIDTGTQISHNTGGRKPKYGYARDYFGRIQERDHYIENRPTNSYHDNSNYDREDDHDSIYDNFD